MTEQTPPPIPVTIVVPSYNRPDKLAACLEALDRQDYSDVQVVVVDDGSDTSLEPICAPYPQMRCLHQKNQGPAAARNAGVAAARDGFVAFTDDDCRPRPDWVTRLVAAHGGDPAVLVGGRVENALTDNVFSAASQTLCDYLYDYFDAAEGEAPFFTSNNMGCLKSHFLELGGFDRTFPLAAAEDRDFGLRWRARFGRLVYAPDAIVDHFHDLSLQKFWRQHSNYGRGARHLHRVMDARAEQTPKLERLAFYFNLLRYPVAQRERKALRQSALMLLSQVAMVYGYARSASAKPAGHPSPKRV
ncbi:MAG: glycosyltransferase [Rhodobacteraceae bacterium]|nr:glycosyltransferase [Paracoccaceae bacterium]